MALEVGGLHTFFARHQGRSRCQMDVEDRAARRLAFDGALGDVGRKVAAVGHRKTNAPGVFAQRAHLGAQDFQLGQAQPDLHQPRRESCRFAFTQRGRRVAPVVHAVPAAKLHHAQLRVTVGVPVHMGLAGALFVTPFEQLQVIFHGVVAVPLDPLVVGDAGLLVRSPDFHRPEQRAQVFVKPVLRASDQLFGVVLEVVPDADGRVARELGADVRQPLDHPQVFGCHVVVTLRPHGSQDDAAVGVEAHGGADVGVLHHKVHHGPHLGLAGRVGAGALLLVFLAPVGREVAVQVQPFAVAVGGDFEAVEICQRALGDDAVVGATKLAGLARHHQAGLLRVLFVGAVRIGNAHAQHATVAVHVFDGQAFHGLFVKRVGPC